MGAQSCSWGCRGGSDVRVATVAQGASEWALQAWLEKGCLPGSLASLQRCFSALLGTASSWARVQQLLEYPMAHAVCRILFPSLSRFLNTPPLSLPSVLPTSTVPHFMTFRGAVSECSPSQELLDQALRGSWGRLSPREQAWAREGARKPRSSSPHWQGGQAQPALCSSSFSFFSRAP